MMDKEETKKKKLAHHDGDRKCPKPLKKKTYICIVPVLTLSSEQTSKKARSLIG
jgi:hypothetical protein